MQFTALRGRWPILLLSLLGAVTHGAGQPEAKLEPLILEANRAVQRGEYRAAESRLREAYRLAQEIGIRDHRYGAILSNLGYLRQRSGRPAEAKQFARQALEVYSSLNRPEEQANVLANLGAIAQDEGRYLDAGKHFRKAIHLLEQTRGARAPQLAPVLSDLASLEYLMRRFTKAERLYERALEIQEAAEPDRHHEVEVGRTLNSLGMVRQSLGDFDGAESRYREALSLAGRGDGEDVELLASALHNLGSLHAERGQLKRAEPALEEAARIWREALGYESSSHAKTLANLGVVHFQGGRYGEAEFDLRRAHAIAESVYGARHPETARILANYAAVLRKLKRKREAREAEREAREILASHAEQNLLYGAIHVTDLKAFR